MVKKSLILVVNDDGVHAQGIRELTRLMQSLGDVIVVAPDAARSGSGCAITPTTPVRLTLIQQENGIQVFACSGTPVDCVKLAVEKVVPRIPDILVSGINHGDNASVSLHYSGTIGAVLEGCMKDIPSVGFSLKTHDHECDFTPYQDTILRIVTHVLEQGLPQDVCLNVNFPQVPTLQGVRVARMARGRWVNEWEETAEQGVYKLTGKFINLEPDDPQTDYWALEHGMAAITPLQLDMTHHPTLTSLHTLQS